MDISHGGFATFLETKRENGVKTSMQSGVQPPGLTPMVPGRVVSAAP